MRLISILIAGAALSGWSLGNAFGQVDEKSLPSIWQEIRIAAELVSREADDGSPSFPDSAKREVEQIAFRHDRTAIESIFRSVGRLESANLPNDPRNLRSWMKVLTVGVMSKVAAPENQVNLITEQNWARVAPHAYDYSPELLKCYALDAMGSYLDERSRNWLIDVAFSDDELSYFALQLLRSYEPTTALRSKLTDAINVDRLTTVRNAAVGMTRGDALRSVLSSWTYSASLENAAVQERYRKFQSRLWRSHALQTVNSRGSRERTSKFRIPAEQLAATWQHGDDRFVLHVFQDAASTPDELRIAVFLAHKLPDSGPLTVLANGNYRHSRYAYDALEWIARQRDAEVPKD